MIIIGHKDIEFESFIPIESIEDLKNSTSNSAVLFDYDVQLCRSCFDNDVRYAVKVCNLMEVIFASNFSALYIVCDTDLVKKAQKFADDYVIDSKILKMIKSEDEIVDTAEEGIDGVWII